MGLLTEAIVAYMEGENVSGLGSAEMARRERRLVDTWAALWKRRMYLVY